MKKTAHSRLASNIIARELACPESLNFAVGDIERSILSPTKLTQNGQASIYGQKADNTVKYYLKNDFRHNYEYIDYSDEVNINIDEVCNNIRTQFKDYIAIRMDKCFSLTHLFKNMDGVEIRTTNFESQNQLMCSFGHVTEYKCDLDDIEYAFVKDTIDKEFTFSAQPDFVGINHNSVKILDIKATDKLIDESDINYETQLKTSLLAVYYDNLKHNRIINNYIGIIYNITTDEIKEYNYNIIELLSFEVEILKPLLFKITKLIPYNNYSEIFNKKEKMPCCHHCKNKYCKNSWAYEENNK